MTPQIDTDIASVVRNMEWQEIDGEFAGKLPAGINSKQYAKIVKYITAVGGRWNRHLKAYVLPFNLKAKVQSQDIRETSPVPQLVIDQMFGLAKPKGTVLVPDAGYGAIVHRCLEFENVTEMVCVEKNKYLCDNLSQTISGNTVVKIVCDTFLDTDPEILGLENGASRVYAMPPSDTGKRGIDQVLHAYVFLKEGGALVAVIDRKILYARDNKSLKFQTWLKKMSAIITPCLACSSQSMLVVVK